MYTYYVLRGTTGGQYLSHRVGSTVHTVKKPHQCKWQFRSQEGAEKLRGEEGRCAWEVVSWESQWSVPGANE